MKHCPQCGDDTETLHEGYCLECCEGNQAALDKHNADLDAWCAKKDAERQRIIRKAARQGAMG